VEVEGEWMEKRRNTISVILSERSREMQKQGGSIDRFDILEYYYSWGGFNAMRQLMRLKSPSP